MRLCTFEDARVGGLEPVALGRPAFGLRCGLTILLDKQLRVVRATEAAAFVRPHIARVTAQDHPHLVVNESAWLAEGPVFLAHARWLPTRRFVAPSIDEPVVATVGDAIAYAMVPPTELATFTPLTVDACLTGWRERLPNRPAVGRLAEHLWDLVEWNGEEIATDYATLGRDEVGGRPGTLALVGPSAELWVHETARVDPFVVADTTNGPVVIDRDAVVTSFTRLEGPCHVGPRTEVFAANVRAGTSLGPNCRVGGELSTTILLGHSNKSHGGYLGHSYVGEWVNVGAGTHVSDLRNDYSDVWVTVGGLVVDTKRTKAGVYLGDHAKLGVGCRVSAGTHVGPFGQLLPSGSLLPKYVPAFCTADQGRLIDCPDPQPLFDAAARVTARRGAEFTAAHRALYKSLFDRSAAHRRLAIHEEELRRLRRG